MSQRHQAPPSLPIVEELAENRRRTQAIAEGFSDDDLVKVHEPTMGPAHWDLGHIGHFEEMWLVHGVDGPEARRAFYDATWDAEKQPRPTRDRLPIPPREGAYGILDASRALTLARLATLDIGPRAKDPLLRDGFLHRLIWMHEAQHQENILVTASLVPDGRYHPAFRDEKPRARARPTGMARVPGGPFGLGSDLRTGVYDNEGPSHEVVIGEFAIDVAPVTNRDYLAFIDAGGYDDHDHWSEDGRDMKMAHRWRHPKHWTLGADGAWRRREYDRLVALPLDEPVVHVSYHEAEAFARWAGKRLPTEAEWEKAATWDPRAGTKRRYPWGDEPWTPVRANLDQGLFGPAPVGSYPDGASPVGCHQMLGDVWEWTSSVFAPYPGFRAHPYEEYSAPFFDRGFQVLRGGSWATRAAVASGTFRNWHQPDHQQIFAGLRCAKGGEAG